MTKQTNQTFVYAFENKTYGGYEYIELDHENKKVAMGNSRAHQGHHINNVSVTVKRKRDLLDLHINVKREGWEFVETFTIFR